MILERLTEQVIGACFEVSNELGIGFLESVYEKALLIRIENPRPLDGVRVLWLCQKGS